MDGPASSPVGNSRGYLKEIEINTRSRPMQEFFLYGAAFSIRVLKLIQKISVGTGVEAGVVADHDAKPPFFSGEGEFRVG